MKRKKTKDRDIQVLKMDSASQLKYWEIENEKTAIYVRTEVSAHVHTDIYRAICTNYDAEIYVVNNGISWRDIKNKLKTRFSRR